LGFIIKDVAGDEGTFGSDEDADSDEE